MIAGSGNTLENYLSKIISSNFAVPAALSILVMIGLMALSVALMFKGKEAWNLLFIALGAYYGYIFALFIISYFHSSGDPVYLILVIGAVIGAILMHFFVRIALAGGFAFLAFVVARDMFPSIITALFVAVLAFIIIYVLYNRVTILISAVMGAFLLWFALLSVGLTSLEAQIIPSILFPIGIYLQMTEKSRSKNRKPRYSHPVYTDERGTPLYLEDR